MSFSLSLFLPPSFSITVSPPFLPLPTCRSWPSMLRWVDPFLTLGPGCEPGVPVRPVLLNALWQLVCERLVHCLSGALLPCSCWQCLHCEREGPCFVLPASLEPVLVQGELAHTSAFSRSICWLYPPAAENIFFTGCSLTFVGGLRFQCPVLIWFHLCNHLPMKTIQPHTCVLSTSTQFHYYVQSAAFV